MEEVCLRILESHAPAVDVMCPVSIPPPAVLLGFQGKEQSLWSQGWRTQHGRQAQLVEVTVRPSPGGPDKGAPGALDGTFTVQAVVGLVV